MRIMTVETLSAISVHFTPEELFVILDQLGGPALLGLSRETFEQLPEAHQTVALDVARRGLIARQLLALAEQGQVKIQAMVAGVIVPCVSPEQSVIIVDSQGVRPARTFYFHQAEAVHVLYQITADNLYRFNLLRNGDTFKLAISNALGLTDLHGSDGPAERLTRASFEQAQTAAEQDGPELAQAGLTEAGLNPTLAAHLASTLAGQAEFKTLTVIDHEAQRSQTLTLLPGRAGSWMLEEEAGQIRIQPVTSATIYDRVQALLN